MIKAFLNRAIIGRIWREKNEMTTYKESTTIHFKISINSPAASITSRTAWLLWVLQLCKVGIRRGRNGAAEYARRRENAGKQKCGRRGKAEMQKERKCRNAEGAEMRKARESGKAECDRIVGR